MVAAGDVALSIFQFSVVRAEAVNGAKAGLAAAEQRDGHGEHLCV